MRWHNWGGTNGVAQLGGHNWGGTTFATNGGLSANTIAKYITWQLTWVAQLLQLDGLSANTIATTRHSLGGTSCVAQLGYVAQRGWHKWGGTTGVAQLSLQLG